MWAKNRMVADKLRPETTTIATIGDLIGNNYGIWEHCMACGVPGEVADGFSPRRFSLFAAKSSDNSRGCPWPERKESRAVRVFSETSLQGEHLPNAS